MQCRRFVAAAALGLTSATLAACGSSGEASDGSPQPASSVTGLPAEFQKTWEIPLIPGYPPFTYADASGETAGSDPELIERVGQVLGVKVDVKQVAFESQLIGLDQGKYVLVPDVTPTVERAEKYDFVSYYEVAYGFAVPADGELGDSMTDVCGMRVGVISGDVQLEELNKQSRESCESAGKPAIGTQAYPNQTDAITALLSRRIDAVSALDSSLAYIAAQGTQIKVAGPRFLESPLTYAIPKGNGLAEYLMQALTEMMADGSYAKILDDNNLSAGAVTKPELNPGV